MTDFFAALLGYFCGSIPFGLLLTQAAGLGDVRKIGSGNIGATNVLRTGNKSIAALTLLCDGLKGFVPVAIVAHFWSDGAALVAGFSAMAGHIFPVWLKFKGGKGVATNIGVLFALSWMIGLMFVVMWIAYAYLFKYSSLSALLSCAITPVIAYILQRYELIAPTVMLAVIIWITHRANIKRLLAGEESKINLSKSA
jgi:acyl phosphate:glycerol-3-phosphate acyltransferase